MAIEYKTIEIATPYSSLGDNTIEIRISDDYNISTNQSTLTIVGARWKSDVWSGVSSTIDGSVLIDGVVAASFIDSSSWVDSISASYPSTYKAPQSSTPIVKTHDNMGALTIAISLTKRDGSSYTTFTLVVGLSPYRNVKLSSESKNLSLTTHPRGIVYIANGSTFEPYQCYIGNGSSWDLAIPYIGNGSSWVQY